MAALRADATTMAQLMSATSDDSRRSIVDSRLGSGTLTVGVYDGTPTLKLSGTFSGADFVSASAAMTAVELASEAGAGGTPDANWTLKISNASDAWIEFPKACWSFVGPSGTDVIDSTDNMFVTLTLGDVTYVPGTPPAEVSAWITQSPVYVPSDFIGVHSDYLTGSAHVVDPGWLDKVGAVRSLDYDPNRGGAGQISWAAIETSAGSYTWTKLDAWVAEYTGKQLIYVLNQCPSFYAKYTTAYNLYPSYSNGASPPSDWTKASDFLLEIKARYPTENIIFEIWNEPGLPWSTETGGAITIDNTYLTRMSDTWMATQGITSGRFYIGTALDLMDGAKTLYNAGVRPLMGVAFVSDASQTNTLYSDIWRFFSCPTTGGGVGYDWFDSVSWHYYDYGGDGPSMVTEWLAYKARFETWNYDTKPIMLSEVGHETVLASTYGNTQHATNVIRWLYISAAAGMSNCVMYQLDSDGAARNLKFYAVEDNATKIAANDALQAAIETAHAIVGKTIGQAAQLSDGSIWLEFTDGTSVRR